MKTKAEDLKGHNGLRSALFQVAFLFSMALDQPEQDIKWLFHMETVRGGNSGHKQYM